MMLSLVVVGVVALAVSALTLFSGFGLGTLLMPAFALFFPLPVAVAATAVVHLLNNLFKVALIHRHAERRVLIPFGVPAVVSAFLGAWLLTRLSADRTLFAWSVGERTFAVTPVKLVLGGLIVGFALFELVPRLRAMRAAPRWLPLGGALSGFFGGLSGHQGALRAAFLTPLGLSPTAFAATQAVLGAVVDLARIGIYGLAFVSASAGLQLSGGEHLHVAVASLCAFSGAALGVRLLGKVTIDAVRVLTGILLLVVGTGLLTGAL